MAFTVDAQNTRTRSSDDRKKSESTTVTRSKSNTESSRSSGRSTSTRPETRSSSTPARTATRPQTRTTSSPARTTSTRTEERKSTGTTATRSSNSSSSSESRSVSPPDRGTRTGTTSTRTRTTSTSREAVKTNPPRDSRSNNSSYRDADRNSGTATRSTRTVETNRNRDSQSVRGGTNVYRPKTSTVHAEKRRTYTTYMPNRVIRPVPSVHYTYRPIEYRRVHYPYKKPRVVHVYWDVHMYNEYRVWYPHYDLWYYPYGYRIHTISAYDAYNYIGEVARVYGKVYDVWHEQSTDQYFLYIGGPYPYQDFTVIMDGWDARRFSRNPFRYFTNRHITVTGLVSSFDGKPEIMVKNKKQVRPY